MQRTVLIFIGAPVALLVVALLVLVIALAVSGDLEPVKAQARAEGLQTDWSDPMWTVGAHHKEAAAELVGLASGIVFHSENHEFSRHFYDATSIRRVKPGVTGSVIPLELHEHYACESPLWLPELTAWHQRHVSRPLRTARPHNQLAYETRKSLEIMIDWLSYRILVADNASLDEARALLDTTNFMALDFGWQAVQRWQILVRVSTLLHHRREAWGNHFDRLISELQARRDSMEVEYRHALQGQFISVCETISRDPFEAARDLGLALPAVFEFVAVGKIVHQLGRVAVLDRQRALTVDLLASTDLMCSFFQARTGCWDGHGKIHITHPAGLLDLIFSYEESAWVTWAIFHRSRLTLDLIIADSTDSPWPRDPMDPVGGPLTPWIENGEVVGAISMGPDRLPGTHYDWHLRLRAPPLPPPATAAP